MSGTHNHRKSRGAASLLVPFSDSSLCHPHAVTSELGSTTPLPTQLHIKIVYMHFHSNSYTTFSKIIISAVFQFVSHRIPCPSSMFSSSSHHVKSHHICDHTDMTSIGCPAFAASGVSPDLHNCENATRGMRSVSFPNYILTLPLFVCSSNTVTPQMLRCAAVRRHSLLVC